MILIDSRIGSIELLPIIKRLNVKADKADLQFGDAAFEGRGPLGSLAVGIERKTLHDMLNCIDDGRYNMQRIGMKQLYTVSILMLEGHWKPHDPLGILMEGFSGGISWGWCRYRSQKTMYSKLFRYLISVALSGVIIIPSRDIFHTAFNITELFQYFQKSWEGHTSLREVQKVNIPTLNLKPSLTRKWATDLEGIGVKLGEQAERIFRKPITLATADEAEWLRVPGVGVKTAQDIWREINGYRKS